MPYLDGRNCAIVFDSVKRHLSRRHLSVLNFNFDFIFDGGCTREEQIALSQKRHLFLQNGRKPKAFWIYFSTLPPSLNIISNFPSSALKRHLLKRHLTLSDLSYRRIASESYRRDLNRWRSLAAVSFPENTEIGPRRPCVRCAAIQIARLAFVGVVFAPRGTAEWPARVDRVR